MKLAHILTTICLIAIACHMTACGDKKAPHKHTEEFLAKYPLIAQAHTGPLSINIDDFSKPELELYNTWIGRPVVYSAISEVHPSEFKTGADYELFMRILNNVYCPCGCNFTLAQCRHEDSACNISPPIIQNIKNSLIDDSKFLEAAQAPSFTAKVIFVPPTSPPADSGQESAKTGPLGMKGPLGKKGQLEAWNLRKHVDDSQITLLVFWATWCPPCLKEIPIFNQLLAEFGPDRLNIVALSLDYEFTDLKIQQMSSKLGINYPVLRGTVEIQKEYYAENLPTTIILDKSGLIRRKIIGAQDHAAMRNFIVEASNSISF